MCDTALTSVGARSQSDARERALASWGRGLRLGGQKANEGQGLALCNPPPSLPELLRCGLKRQAAGGRSTGQVGISTAILGLIFVPELGRHYFQRGGSLSALREQNSTVPFLSLSTPPPPPSPSRVVRISYSLTLPPVLHGSRPEPNNRPWANTTPYTFLDTRSLGSLQAFALPAVLPPVPGPMPVVMSAASGWNVLFPALVLAVGHNLPFSPGAGELLGWGCG